MSVRESLVYSCPVGVAAAAPLVEVGVDSDERVGHTMRINEVLGCYYTHFSEIPD